MTNTLFQVENKVNVFKEAWRVLKLDGTLVVIDWSESFGGLGPHPEAVVDEAAARALAETAGFVFERSFDAGDHHYGLAFRKP